MGISLVKRQEERTESSVRVAFYMRVSTAEQSLEGYSPDFQKAQLLDHVKRKEYRGWITRPEWHFFDVGSGSEMEGRQQLQRLMECVRRDQIDIILVWKIDRLSRNLSDLLGLFDEFSKHRVGFASMKEDLDFTGPIGRLIYQVFGALAEFERETIKLRTEEGRKASALAGNYVGTIAPYGFEAVPNPGGKGRKLQIIPHEGEIVKQVFHWFVYDHWSAHRIATELNHLKVPKGKANKSARGTAWREFTIRTMLGSEEYRGVFITNRYKLVQKKPRKHEELPREEWIIVHMPAIVDDIIYYMAQERLKETSLKRGGGGAEQYLLRSKLIEVGTGRRFVGYLSAAKTKNYRRKQYQQGPLHYRSLSIAAKPLDTFVWSTIERALTDPEGFLRLHEESSPSGLEQDKLTRSLRIAEERLSEVNAKIEKVNEDYYAKRIDDSERQNWLDRFKDERNAALDMKLASERDLGALGNYKAACDNLREVAQRFQRNSRKFTFEEQQAIVDMLVERVEILDNDDGRSAKLLLRFDPKKIASSMPGVEPDRVLLKPKTRVAGSKTVVDGASEGSGYFLFALETNVDCLGSNQFRKRVLSARI
ncbi:MAG: recombinase family protein [Gemmataceae bacterium]